LVGISGGSSAIVTRFFVIFPNPAREMEGYYMNEEMNIV
jgi:hypothetical protein